MGIIQQHTMKRSHPVSTYALRGHDSSESNKTTLHITYTTHIASAKEHVERKNDDDDDVGWFGGASERTDSEKE